MKTLQDPMRIIKCGCGLPMRRKDWLDHWRACKLGTSVEVTKDDIANLEAQEKRLAEEYDRQARRVKEVQAARSEGRVSW